MSTDTSVAVTMESMALVREIAEHENITFKQVVDQAIFKYWNVWNSLEG